ncbi:hypothetical protein MLD38_035119 [Melastoma candidum]|uniref:Uncharacterized protein n=1 Tax=Melastoma candidum TaxID=119954 RepID=A0ACB9MDS7_9MYRT|nr:hypothetical protein MLD38_035119 [Melastoma candidum]
MTGGEEEVILLDFWASMLGMRCRLGLTLKGINYEYREEDLRNKSPLLLQMNPIHKKIPVLVHNGRPVCESLIILHYIDECLPDTYPLLPSDPYERSQSRFCADFVDKKFYETGRKVWSTKGEEQESAKRDLMEIIKLLEVQLGDKPFFGGERLGFLDVAVVPFSTWFYSYQKLGNFSMEGECPKLMAWVNRCLEIESVSKSLVDPHKVYAFVLQLKKALGLE